MFARLLALPLLLTATPAAAQHFGEWQVGMGPQRCSAQMRQRDGAEVLLSRSTTDPGTIIRVTPPLLRGRSGGDPFGTYGFDLKISGHRAWRETVARLDGGSPGGGGAAAAVDPDGFARILASGVVQATGNGPTVEIPLPPGNAVEREIHACLEKLRIAERGSGEPMAVRPEPWSAFEPWLTGVTAGLEHFTGAKLRLRLTVAAQGHLLGCTVTKSSGDAELDRSVCDTLLPRAHFTPAADAAGRPTLGTYEVGIELESNEID